MRITDMLFKAAGKELGWFGAKRLQPQDVYKVESMAAAYGKSVVLSDFESWAEEVRGQDISYPVSAYIKLADARLKQVNESGERQDDPRIMEIVTSVVSVCQRIPLQSDIKKLLEKYDAPEIKSAFEWYVSNLDNYEMKFSVKNFFRDGGGEGVILARRKIKQDQQDLKLAGELAVAAGKAEFEKEEVAEESEGSLDSLFGDPVGH